MADNGRQIQHNVNMLYHQRSTPDNDSYFQIHRLDIKTLVQLNSKPVVFKTFTKILSNRPLNLFIKNSGPNNEFRKPDPLIQSLTVCKQLLSCSL